MSKYDRSQKDALNSYRIYNAFAFLLQSFFIKKIHRKILSVWKFNKIFICIGFWHFPLIRFCDRNYKFIWFSNSFLLPIAYVWEIRPVLLGRSYLILRVTDHRSPITDHRRFCPRFSFRDTLLFFVSQNQVFFRQNFSSEVFFFIKNSIAKSHAFENSITKSNAFKFALANTIDVKKMH